MRDEMLRRNMSGEQNCIQKALFARNLVSNLFGASKVGEERSALQYTVSVCLVHSAIKIKGCTLLQNENKKKKSSRVFVKKGCVCHCERMPHRRSKRPEDFLISSGRFPRFTAVKRELCCSEAGVCPHDSRKRKRRERKSDPHA